MDSRAHRFAMPRNDRIVSRCGSRRSSQAKAEQSYMAVGGLRPCRMNGFTFHGNERLPVLASLAQLRLVIARDLHGPIGPLAAGIPCAGDADARGIVQQQ